MDVEKCLLFPTYSKLLAPTPPIRLRRATSPQRGGLGFFDGPFLLEAVGAIQESPAAAQKTTSLRGADRPPWGAPCGGARIFRCRRHRGNGTEAVPYRIVTKTPAFRRAYGLFQGIDGLPRGLDGGGGGVLAVEFAGHGQAHGHALALKLHGAGLGSLGT